MRAIEAIVAKRGRVWRAYVWGQPSGHLMDRRGTNYRTLSVTRNAFTSKQGAIDFLLGFFDSRESMRHWASRRGDGTFIPGGFEFEVVYIEEPA